MTDYLKRKWVVLLFATLSVPITGYVIWVLIEGSLDFAYPGPGFALIFTAICGSLTILIGIADLTGCIHSAQENNELFYQPEGQEESEQEPEPLEELDRR